MPEPEPDPPEARRPPFRIPSEPGRVDRPAREPGAPSWSRRRSVTTDPSPLPPPGWRPAPEVPARVFDQEIDEAPPLWPRGWAYPEPEPVLPEPEPEPEPVPPEPEPGLPEPDVDRPEPDVAPPEPEPVLPEPEPVLPEPEPPEPFFGPPEPQVVLGPSEPQWESDPPSPAFEPPGPFEEGLASLRLRLADTPLANLGELTGRRMDRRAVVVNDHRVGKLEPEWGRLRRLRSLIVLVVLTLVVAAVIAAVLAIAVEALSVAVNHAVSKSAGA